MRVVVRLGLSLVACLGALVISGCSSAQSLPPGPTPQQIEDYTQNMLDATWRSTALNSQTRPEEPHGELVDREDWDPVMRGCMSTAGYNSVGFAWGTDMGYFLSDDEGAIIDDPAQQLEFYRCVNRNPMDPVSSGDVMSDAQLDYRFDFFARWTIPCLEAQGFTILDIPERDIYLSSSEYSHWSPLWSIPVSSQEEYEQLVMTCGPPEPPM